MWPFCITSFCVGAVILVFALCIWARGRFSAFACADTFGVVHGVKAGLMHAGDLPRKSYGLLVTYQVDGNAYTAELPAAEADIDGAIGRKVPLRYKLCNPQELLLDRRTSLGRAVIWLLHIGTILTAASAALVITII